MKRLPGVEKLRIGLAQFPGSNCDADCLLVLKKFYDLSLVKIWHTDPLPQGLDGLIIPGGFSYGDYLRGGALASHSPLMAGLPGLIKQGAAVIGICNGFQILTEARLLPGVLLKNQSQKFICRFVNLAVGEGKSGYHEALGGKTLRVPIAHGEGRYYLDEAGLRQLKAAGQILFQYADEQGRVNAAANPNGALENIAGVTDVSGRVMGMMPHPERSCDPMLVASQDGLLIWDAFVKSML
jgi:phosphoribosylformylglycinamidine synthase